jgi:hypothetical protein
MLVSCLAWLKIKAICSSETSVDFQWTTRRYNPEDIILHNHRCKNLKSYTIISVFVFIFLRMMMMINFGRVDYVTRSYRGAVSILENSVGKRKQNFWHEVPL